MPKRIAASIILIALLVIPSGVAQQSPQAIPATPRTFRFISEWKVPRKSIQVFAAELEKNVRPILQRMMQDEIVFDYGTYMTIIKEDDGSTNGYWFEIPTMAALQKVLDELAKLPPSAIGDSAIKQHDYLLRNHLRVAKPSSGSNGYLYFHSSLIQPGKSAQWRQWWDRYQRPRYEKYLADGLITMYEFDSGEMHTMDPNWWYLVWVSPTADALDKMNLIKGAQFTLEERGDFEAVVVAGSHRDYFARAISYASKCGPWRSGCRE